MELKFDVTGTQRKEMVSIISDTVHMKAVYKFMPTCAYVIDNMTVSKEGTLLWDERTSQETIDAVLAALTTAGFSYEGEKQEPEQPAADESGLTVSLPKEGFSDMALENLNHLLDAKGTLIKKALGIEALPLEITDERVSFPWFHRDLTPDEVQTYMNFIANLCAMAKNAKRITATEYCDYADALAESTADYIMKQLPALIRKELDKKEVEIKVEEKAYQTAKKAC